MKALVIGYGSIGARHARLLGDLGLDVAVVSRRAVDAGTVYGSTAEAVEDRKTDYVVVASRTDEHRDDFAALASAGFEGTLLMEKPLFDSGVAVPKHLFKNVYVAYNTRFHPVLCRFREILAGARAHAVHAYVGQYLPDWRPQTDYRKSYSADKSRGGGVLRDLSHELDYLNWCLGGWQRLTALGGHLSDLEIDSDDVFSILFETRNCPVVSAQMNYLDSTLRREVLALTDHGSLRADFVRGTVEFDGRTEIFEVDRDDTYIAEHKAAIAGDATSLCSLDEAIEVVRMIDAAEAAAEDGLWKAA